MVAGIFAFAPVQQASTVHSASLIESNVSSIGAAFLIATDSGTGITDEDTVVIDCDEDFIVNDMYWEITGYDGVTNGGEQLQIGADDGTLIIIDGVKLIGGDADSSTTFDLINPSGNTADGVNVKISWASVIHDTIMSTNGGFMIPPQLFAAGGGSNDIVIEISDNNDGGGADNPFEAGDTLTVTALIQTQSNAICTVSVNT